MARNAGWTRRSARRDAGAGLVEYGLALALLVVGSIGAIQFLEDETEDELDNQADCIETRPPPDSCQQAALAPQPAPGDPPPPPDPPPPVAEATYDEDASEYTVTGDQFEIHLEFNFSSPTPPTGEVGTVRVTFTDAEPASREGEFEYVTCTVDSSGLCAVDINTQYPGVSQVSVELIALGNETGYTLDPCTDCGPHPVPPT